MPIRLYQSSEEAIGTLAKMPAFVYNDHYLKQNIHSMRRKGTTKLETRRKMVSSVGRGFRQHGYAGIGVDGLAKSAGVTSGAFYAHFKSKDGAFIIALESGLEDVIRGIPEYQSKYGINWVKEFSRYYLDESHRKDLACGCAMASLTPEVVRSNKSVHTLYEKKMKTIVDLIANGLASGTHENKLDRAWAMLSVLIGGLNMSRAVNSSQAAEEIARSVISSAIKTAGRTRKAPKN